MIDVDNSGTLTKQEIITAVKENKEVKMFLANCGNENLQYLLVPSRLNHALSVLDKDGDDEIDANEWEDAIAKALQKKLEQRRAMREANAEAFRKEIEEFTANFLNAAREAFALIDKDDSGSLSKTEIVRAVREDRPVIDFLRNCGEENLQFLLQPARLEKALEQLDTDNSGEVDVDECTGAASCVYVREIRDPHAIDATPARWRGSFQPRSRRRREIRRGHRTHGLIHAQGRRRSTAAWPSASSSSRPSRSGACARRPRPTRSSAPSS
jgi:Ca2+-binding EF-hand superfamily protein